MKKFSAILIISIIAACFLSFVGCSKNAEKWHFKLTELRWKAIENEGRFMVVFTVKNISKNKISATEMYYINPTLLIYDSAGKNLNMEKKECLFSIEGGEGGGTISFDSEGRVKKIESEANALIPGGSRAFTCYVEPYSTNIHKLEVEIKFLEKERNKEIYIPVDENVITLNKTNIIKE